MHLAENDFAAHLGRDERERGEREGEREKVY